MLGVPTDISSFDSRFDDRSDALGDPTPPRPLHALVSAADVALARRAGMDPRDVSALREFAAARFLVVVRCPRPSRAAAEGPRRAAPRRPRPYTGTHRVVVSPRTPPAPPCDLMSVWKLAGARPERVRFSAPANAPRARTPFEATAIVLELNSRLVARVRHVCQDDEAAAGRAVVADADRFVAFGQGGATYLPSAAACAAYYREHGLHWPHGAPAER